MASVRPREQMVDNLRMPVGTERRAIDPDPAPLDVNAVRPADELIRHSIRQHRRQAGTRMHGQRHPRRGLPARHTPAARALPRPQRVLGDLDGSERDLAKPSDEGSLLLGPYFAVHENRSLIGWEQD